jgi:uncharacterized protein (TIGR00297 family)
LHYIIVVIFLFIGVVESIRRRKLTVAGAIAGGVIGLLVFIGAGFTGLAMLAAFFLLGTTATAWKRKQKTQVGMAQEEGSRRNLGQVLANGGISGMLGLLALFLPEQKDLFAFLMAGAFSAAMADTLSSELGTIYGKRFYNIITFQKDERGSDGVISLEGTIFGVIGSSIIALIYCSGVGWNEHFFWIVLAGIIGNLTDSVLGATLERKQVIGNDAVNALNTLTGILVLLLFL